MTSTLLAVLFALFSASLREPVQAAEPTPQELARLAAAIEETRQLSQTELTAAQERLQVLLGQFRQWRDSGSVGSDGARLYQDALLLHIGVQTRLLVPEEEILNSFRELMRLNPVINPELFNPREKLLLERSRLGSIGNLSVRTQPTDVSLLYLGNELGRTPLDIPLVAGRYHFLLRRTGYLDQEFDADIRTSEILLMERSMRRSTISLPLSTSVPAITISLNGRIIGQTQPYDPWLASQSAELRPLLQETVARWNLQTRTAGFFLLTEIPVGEDIELAFQAACYESRSLKLSVGEEQIDWTRPVVILPELRSVELTREVGFLEVNSSPQGAEVWMDGVLQQGKTPLGMEVCAGTHRLQILGGAGQYSQEVVLRKGQVSKVTGELKPALVFLGAYERREPAVGPELLLAESQAMIRRLALRSTTFRCLQLLPEDIEALRRKGTLAIEALLAADGSPAAEDTLRRTSAACGRANLILLGLRTQAGFVMRLWSTLHPLPDEIPLPSTDEGELDFIIERLNRAAEASKRLHTADLGMALLDSSDGLLIRKLSGDAAAAGLRPGMVVKTVDRKPMSLRELRQHLHDLAPGQTVLLDISSDSGAGGTVSLPVRHPGREYPWSAPDSYPNAVMTFLHHLAEREAPSTESKYARLGLALGFMYRTDWSRALAALSDIQLDSVGAGVNQGTVLYHQARCYEQLGDGNNASDYYNRAQAHPDATLGTADGMPVSELCEHRLRALKSPSR